MLKVCTAKLEGVPSRYIIPLQKYVLQETLVNIIGVTRKFFYLHAKYNYYSENKNRRYYRQLDYLIELATLIASQV